MKMNCLKCGKRMLIYANDYDDKTCVISPDIGSEPADRPDSRLANDPPIKSLK
jgi:hypothetical protein